MKHFSSFTPIPKVSGKTTRKPKFPDFINIRELYVYLEKYNTKAANNMLSEYTQEFLVPYSPLEKVLRNSKYGKITSPFPQKPELKITHECWNGMKDYERKKEMESFKVVLI